MQLRLPLLAPADIALRTITIAGRTYDVTIARHRRARRYVLRLSDDGALRLTVPRGAPIAGGLSFVRTQARWIERERVRQQRRAAAWIDGTLAWYRGALEVVRIAGLDVAIGDVQVRRRQAAEDPRHAVEARLKAIAAAELPARCFELAAQVGLAVSRVSVRNQRSRWGACSPRGVITLNWRLLLMPPSVSDYVIYHELMHLRQANHSRRFWREVDGVCAWWRDAERWLRRHGRELL